MLLTALLNGTSARRVGGAVVLAGLAVSSLPGCVSNWNRYKDERLVTMTHDTVGDLWVESVNGSVRISPSESGLVRIEATLAGPSLDRLADSAIVAERRDGGIFVGVQWAGGVRKQNEGCDFTIAIPTAVLVSVRTSNDEVVIEGVGERVDVRTSNDDVTVLGVLGAVDIRTSNDDVKVVGSHGPVDVKTSNDSVYVAMAPDANEPVTISTSNGDIELVVGYAFGGELSAGTSNGKVRVYGDAIEVHRGHSKKQAELTFDRAGGRSRLSTSNSDITIVVEE